MTEPVYIGGPWGYYHYMGAQCLKKGPSSHDLADIIATIYVLEDSDAEEQDQDQLIFFVFDEEAGPDGSGPGRDAGQGQEEGPQEAGLLIDAGRRLPEAAEARGSERTGVRVATH